jgi:hypothetical protein
MVAISDIEYLNHIADVFAETLETRANMLSSEDNETHISYTARGKKEKGFNRASSRQKLTPSTKTPAKSDGTSLIYARQIAYFANQLRSILGSDVQVELPPKKTRAECKSFSKKRARERASKTSSASSDDE